MDPNEYTNNELSDIKRVFCSNREMRMTGKAEGRRTAVDILLEGRCTGWAGTGHNQEGAGEC